MIAKWERIGKRDDSGTAALTPSRLRVGARDAAVGAAGCAPTACAARGGRGGCRFCRNTRFDTEGTKDTKRQGARKGYCRFCRNSNFLAGAVRSTAEPVADSAGNRGCRDGGCRFCRKSRFLGWRTVPLCRRLPFLPGFGFLRLAMSGSMAVCRTWMEAVYSVGKVRGRPGGRGSQHAAAL